MIKYPIAIDSYIELPTIINNQTAVDASYLNNMRDALLAVETELGVKPSGIYGTVRSRFSAIETTLSNLIGGGANAIQLQGTNVSATTPTDGQGLIYNAGNLEWEPGDVSITIPGSDTQVLFKDGTALGADAGFTYNKTSNVVSISDGIAFNGGAHASAYVKLPYQSSDQKIIIGGKNNVNSDVSFIQYGPGHRVDFGNNTYNMYIDCNALQIVSAQGALTAYYHTAAQFYNYATAAIQFQFNNTGGQFYDGTPVIIGSTNPSASGDIRLKDTGSIKARNDANSADLNLLSVSADDILLGDTGIGAITISASQVNLLQTTTTQNLGTYGSVIDTCHETTTTDDTTTDLFTWTIEDNALTAVDISVTACQSTSEEGDHWKGTIVFRRDGGSVTVISAGDVTQFGSSAWVVELDNSTSTARLRITGEAATDIRWNACLRRQITTES